MIHFIAQVSSHILALTSTMLFSKWIGEIRGGHKYAVSSVQCGMWTLYTESCDGAIRFWDVDSGCNTLVNYENTHMQSSKATQLAVSPNFSFLFVPTLTVIRFYNL